MYHQLILLKKLLYNVFQQNKEISLERETSGLPETGKPAQESGRGKSEDKSCLPDPTEQQRGKKL